MISNVHVHGVKYRHALAQEVECNGGNSMRFSLCTREVERDYFWIHDDPVAKTWSKYFEGSIASGKFCALIREVGTNGVCLYVSVATPRRDFRGRPIRIIVKLMPDSERDAGSLLSYISGVLLTNDAETLADAGSRFSRVFESLYKTDSLDDFEKEFGGKFPIENAEPHSLMGRFAFPRNDLSKRREVAAKLFSLVMSKEPFLVALVERYPDEMLEDMHWDTESGNLLIFSSQTTQDIELPVKRATNSDFTRTPTAVKVAIVIGLGLLGIALVGLGIRAIFSGNSPNASEKQQKVQLIQ